MQHYVFMLLSSLSYVISKCSLMYFYCCHLYRNQRQHCVFCCCHLYCNQRHVFRYQRHRAWCVSVVVIFIVISDIQLDVVLRCLPHLQPEQRYPKSLPSLSPRSDRIHCRKGTVHNLSEGTLHGHLSITWHLPPGHHQRSQGGQRSHEIIGTSPADCMTQATVLERTVKDRFNNNNNNGNNNNG